MLYSFDPAPLGLGTGTSNLALARSVTPPIQSIYGPRYNVKGYLAATRLGFMKFTQEVPIVALNGNGTYIAGQMALQSLIDLANEKKAKSQ